ncbi:glyceraldehyde 3-phosphate dehydrogenase [Actinophytocola algeriensis]|uniref:Glyceraldehyde 3-phosphate dehydrogenase n=1 Tax=Actinophytocola algeriensis TaxID=1768010 RepID=A0A7W7QC95_9PSEU|nr:glyceraldehyde 3-phosphate dehydrogenase [Actinophytocola algeriensis]MBE1473632.1 glyceraldehyde 3-phosphate dehydrogenase [Actinophytocola algeriensis]
MLRASLSSGLIRPQVICDIVPVERLAPLLEVDTNYGRWRPVEVKDDSIVVAGEPIAYRNSSESVPDWGELGIDLVVDCTGRAVTRAVAEQHLERGAKRVLVSAPSKSLDDCDAVLLPGINLDSFDSDRHRIVSMASCTTNALAPVVKVLRDLAGIDVGLFSTVHAYTNTQSLTDQPMRDRRDSWSAAENIIPSPSGASKALRFVWPDLRITGKAYRVPVRTGSIVELNIVPSRPVSVAEVNDAFRAASEGGPLSSILGVLEDEWTSARIIGEQRSSIVDLPLTQTQDGELLSVAAWYDNEYGYAMRLAETASALAASGRTPRS